MLVIFDVSTMNTKQKLFDNAPVHGLCSWPQDTEKAVM